MKNGIYTYVSVAFALLCLLPTLALAQVEIALDFRQEEGNSLAVYSAKAGGTDALSGQEQMDQGIALIMLNALLEERFAQSRAASVYEQALRRGEARIEQTAYGSSGEGYCSVARVWSGEQPGGRSGVSAASLTIDPATGREIVFDDLFADPAAAAAHMEAILESDVLEGMSDYMEFADLLPMPKDCFVITPEGLTVFWPEDRYRYFSGELGSVTFLWHEIAPFIGEDSPVYALSRPQPADAEDIRALAALGCFDAESPLRIGAPLGSAAQAHLLADPDYTSVSLVYPLERVRGAAVEIPKYAGTPEEETGISAVRMACLDWHGLTVGSDTREEIISLLGEPQSTEMFGEEAALDMMLEPGESLYYAMGDHVLQAHLDASGVLSCLIIRDEIAQRLL